MGFTFYWFINKKNLTVPCIGVSVELNFNSSILEIMDLLKSLRKYRDVTIWVFVIGLQKRASSSLEAVCFSNTGAILTT